MASVILPDKFQYSDLQEAYDAHCIGRVEPSIIRVNPKLFAYIYGYFEAHTRFISTYPSMLPSTTQLIFNRARIIRAKHLQDNELEFTYEEDIDEFTEWVRETRRESGIKD